METREQRAHAKRIRQANAAIADIRRIESTSNLTTEEWAAISRIAGELQRRARILGGLGRGG